MTILTHKEIAELAQEAGITLGSMFADDLYAAVLHRFATLVANAEREICTQVANEWAMSYVEADGAPRTVGDTIRLEA